MDENKVGSSLKDKREYDKKLLKDQRLKLQIENQKKDPGFNKKSKEMTKKMIEENIFKNSNNNNRKSDLLEKLLEKNKIKKTAKNLSELEGAKPGINKPTGKIQAFKTGGRVEYKHGGGVGCAKRGFGKALKKGKK